MSSSCKCWMSGPTAFQSRSIHKALVAALRTSANGLSKANISGSTDDGSLILLCHLGRNAFLHHHEFKQQPFLGSLPAEPVAEAPMHLRQGLAPAIPPSGKKAGGVCPVRAVAAAAPPPARPRTRKPTSP